ncbi:YqaA family protein [Chelativorans salis]|uniref:DedA family protein n=1 Tax=Chelativorans salis TaxID=2978478 RepID=A0ABT2LP19_9HYPH|nr:YqaA family protein [Chelativorans sp. EGI FJ00035]MCT7374929.1 DedA family protein [Chelativorans sp. EGI FJ00035]
MIAASFSLFFASFLSATLLPGASELLLIALLTQSPEAAGILVAVAAAGNTAGSAVNYALGYWIGRPVAERLPFILTKKRLEQAEGWFGRYGRWSLLFSWLPIVGDPLTAIAGVLKTGFGPFLVLVALGKTARYMAVAAGVQAVALW